MSSGTPEYERDAKERVQAQNWAANDSVCRRSPQQRLAPLDPALYHELLAPPSSYPSPRTAHSSFLFMPVTYDDLGIRFLFPENWSLEADDELPDRPSVTIYSPGGAFWTVVRRGPSDDLDQMAEEAAAAVREEYPGSDTEPVHETVGNVELQGYDLTFFCLDLINTACVRVCRTASATYLIVYQAEDRDFVKLRDVFRALTVSLLQESSGKHA